MKLPDGRRIRLAIVVSHPIQYYVPLYQLLTQREEMEVRVFYTWHAGQGPVLDRGFEKVLAWDIPLTEGYEFELVPNLARDPGTHRFGGLRNPALAERLLAWRPDVVHVTGWAWASHLRLLRQLARRDVPVLFRGDSHLLDTPRSGWRWWVKRSALSRVYSWPAVFLYVGEANRAYYESFGVEPARLRYCPHSIDVARFAEPGEVYEREAREWRRALGIAENARVLLYAGKFERRKQPMELIHALLQGQDESLHLVLVGGGELEGEVRALAAAAARIRVLPFQNQSRMPVVYRLGDVFVLPSAYGESWGLAVNEALACGRPVLVSDRVGCAADVVDESCGRVTPWDDLRALMTAARAMTSDQANLRQLSQRAAKRSWRFDISRTADTTVEAALAARPV